MKFKEYLKRFDDFILNLKFKTVFKFLGRLFVLSFGFGIMYAYEIPFYAGITVYFCFYFYINSILKKAYNVRFEKLVRNFLLDNEIGGN